LVEYDRHGAGLAAMIAWIRDWGDTVGITGQSIVFSALAPDPRRRIKM
jgi:hypothetical protein